MKQLRPSIRIITQTLAVAIFIAMAAWPTRCQEKNEQKAELVLQTGHTAQSQSVAFSPDGEYLASSDRLGATKLWKISTGQELRTLPGSYSVFSPDDKTLATSGVGLKLWNWRTGQELQTLQQHVITGLIAFSPKGDVLANVNSLNNTIKLWDVKSGQVLRVLAGHTSLIGSVVFSPDDKTLASEGADKTIKLWNWKTGDQLRTINAWISSFSSSLAFSPDGETIAGPVVAGNITLWNVATGQKLREFDNTRYIGSYSLAFSQGGKVLVTAFWDSW